MTNNKKPIKPVSDKDPTVITPVKNITIQKCFSAALKAANDKYNELLQDLADTVNPSL